MEAVGLDCLLKGNGLAEESIASKQIKGPEPAKTLDSYHNAQIAKFREEKAHLADLQAELKIKRAELKKVDEEFNGPRLITNAIDIQVITSRQRIENDIC